MQIHSLSNVYTTIVVVACYFKENKLGLNGREGPASEFRQRW